MTNADTKFWPFKPRFSIVISIVLAIVMLIITGIIRSIVNWPSEASPNAILIGILLLSLLPVFLAIFDAIISKGGSIGYKDFKIDLGKYSNQGFQVLQFPQTLACPVQRLLIAEPAIYLKY